MLPLGLGVAMDLLERLAVTKAALATQLLATVAACQDLTAWLTACETLMSDPVSYCQQCSKKRTAYLLTHGT
jgi:hypothetical protein